MPKTSLKKIPFLFLLLFLHRNGSDLQASFYTSPGTAGCQFLTVPISARSLALGSGLVGLAEDIHGYEYNPAMLSSLTDSQLTLTRSNLFDDGHLTSFALALASIKSIGFGLQFRRFATSTMGRDEEGYQTEEVNMSENGFSLGTSYRFLNRLALGYSIEYIRRNIFSYSSVSFTHSLGLQIGWINGRHTLGISLQNLGNPSRLIATDEPMPTVLRFGGSHKIRTKAMRRPKAEAKPSRPAILGIWEINQFREARHLSGSAGIEWRIFSMIALRAGISYREIAALTAGMGIKWGSFQFDYGFQNKPKADLEHSFSFLIRWQLDAEDFGESKEEFKIDRF